MTQNEHVCAIYCLLEVNCDVISGRTVKTVMGYAVVNIEVASFSNFLDILPPKSFRDDGGGRHRW